MRRRNLLTSMVCVVLAGAVMCGCGTKTDEGASKADAGSGAAQEQGASKESAGESAGDGEQVVLKWYTETDEVSNKNVYKTQEIADAFMEKYPNVKVEVQPLVANTNNEEYAKKVDLMLASGEQIDIMNFSSSSNVMQKINAGVLEPLNEYAENRGVDLKNDYKGAMEVDGKIYQIVNQDSAYIVFINEDMLREAGLENPPIDWTWEGYADYAEKLTKGEGRDKVYGSYFHTWNDFYQIGTLGVIPGNSFYKEDGSANFDHPAIKGFMEFRNRIENVDQISMPYIDIKTQNLAYRSLFFDSKVAMMPQGTWMLTDIKDQEKYPHTFRTTFAALPRYDETAAPNTTISTYGLGYCVNANSKHKQEAFDLINFITSEGYNISKAFLSPWKEADHAAIAASIMGDDQSLYDLDAFNKVMYESDMIENNKTYIPVYDREIDAIQAEEGEKYLTGLQDIDTTINNMQTRATEIIEKNK
ncbi:MAG: extracellular solute-binding protein [Clostridiaceae bacterium]|nr:extracellular solute-binding protein [Clostridiaceae bacterium]